MNNGWQTLVDGFTYQGSVRHCTINYALILLTVLPYLIKAARLAHGVEHRWYLALLVSLLVQVSLWFLLRAVGVSVVWCAMAGYNLMVLRSNSGYNQRKTALLLSLVAALAGIVYYAVTFPFITTVAHIIAAALGMALFYVCRRSVIQRKTT